MIRTTVLKRTLTTLCTAALLAGGLNAGSGAYANPITQVDQQNLLANGAIGAPSGKFDGYGQSFTPTLTGIDAFEFFAFERAFGPVIAMDWQINIREGTLTGTILGTSNPVSGVFTTGDPINFMFPTRIPLTPGNVYVSEILFSTSSHFLEANINLFFDPNPPGDVYSGGELLGLGDRSLDDYKFREGLNAANPIPEPSTMLLLGSGLVGLIGYRWKKAHA